MDAAVTFSRSVLVVITSFGLDKWHQLLMEWKRLGSNTSIIKYFGRLIVTYGFMND